MLSITTFQPIFLFLYKRLVYNVVLYANVSLVQHDL